MAQSRLLKISKTAAHVFSKTISNADTNRDEAARQRFRRIGKRIRDEFCVGYSDVRFKLEEQYDLDMLEYMQNTPEWHEAIRRLNKSVRELDQGVGKTLAQNPDTGSPGLLFSYEDFKWLSDKLNNLKGIPTEGFMGDVWEEIYTAFDKAEEVKVREVVDDNKEKVS